MIELKNAYVDNVFDLACQTRLPLSRTKSLRDGTGRCSKAVALLHVRRERASSFGCGTAILKPNPEKGAGRGVDEVKIVSRGFHNQTV